ncbi:hypothetical protein PV327_006881 [Microctonus hyperodae]|uniref:BTB domain-containing protein n=1 Tax=Microctonus hyperodae TaxID=165561 RepID=A0AA39F566_MICHY|nr:hypothetical protein PV327_006881 [Microctonus hyperodae]
MTDTSEAQNSDKKILISHKWTLGVFSDSSGHKQLSTYTNSFVSESLPNEIFYIFCGAKSKTEVTVAVSKFSSESVKAVITVIFEKQKNTVRKIDDWTSNCIFNTIPCTIQYSQNYEFTCEIMWEGFPDTEILSSVDLRRHIEYFVSEPDFNDLVIKIDDKEILAHKVILSAYSPVFLAMFKSDMAESEKNEIVLNDIAFDIMQLVIKFMYSGKVDSELPVDDLLSMLYVSDKYDVTDLKKLCEKILILKISIYNVFKIFENAHLYRASNLITSGKEFMKKNKHTVIKSDDFTTLYLTKPELLLDFFIENIAESPERQE